MIRKIQEQIQALRDKTKLMKGKRGFSLAEVLIVVAIIAIFVFVAMPDFRNALMSSRKTACESDVKAIGDAVMRYYAETGKIPEVGSMEALKTELTRDDMEVDGRPVGPWMKENMNITDPWGQDFTWTSEGNHYDICSPGDPGESKEICYNKLGRSAKN